MKVTEKQLLIMYDTLMDSLALNIVGIKAFRWDQKLRTQIVEAFANQQSDRIVDVRGDVPQEVHVCDGNGAERGKEEGR